MSTDIRTQLNQIDSGFDLESIMKDIEVAPEIKKSLAWRGIQYDRMDFFATAKNNGDYLGHYHFDGHCIYNGKISEIYIQLGASSLKSASKLGFEAYDAKDIQKLPSLCVNDSDPQKKIFKILIPTVTKGDEVSYYFSFLWPNAVPQSDKINSDSISPKVYSFNSPLKLNYGLSLGYKANAFNVIEIDNKNLKVNKRRIKEKKEGDRWLYSFSLKNVKSDIYIPFWYTQ